MSFLIKPDDSQPVRNGLAVWAGMGYSNILHASLCFGCPRRKAGRSYAVAQPVRTLLVGASPSLWELAKSLILTEGETVILLHVGMETTPQSDYV